MCTWYLVTALVCCAAAAHVGLNKEPFVWEEEDVEKAWLDHLLSEDEDPSPVYTSVAGQVVQLKLPSKLRDEEKEALVRGQQISFSSTFHRTSRALSENLEQYAILARKSRSLNRRKRSKARNINQEMEILGKGKNIPSKINSDQRKARRGKKPISGDMVVSVSTVDPNSIHSALSNFGEQHRVTPLASGISYTTQSSRRTAKSKRKNKLFGKLKMKHRNRFLNRFPRKQNIKNANREVSNEKKGKQRFVKKKAIRRRIKSYRGKHKINKGKKSFHKKQKNKTSRDRRLKRSRVKMHNSKGRNSAGNNRVKTNIFVTKRKTLKSFVSAHTLKMSQVPLETTSLLPKNIFGKSTVTLPKISADLTVQTLKVPSKGTVATTNVPTNATMPTPTVAMEQRVLTLAGPTLHVSSEAASESKKSITEVANHENSSDTFEHMTNSEPTTAIQGYPSVNRSTCRLTTARSRYPSTIKFTSSSTVSTANGKSHYPSIPHLTSTTPGGSGYTSNLSTTKSTTETLAIPEASQLTSSPALSKLVTAMATLSTESSNLSRIGLGDRTPSRPQLSSLPPTPEVLFRPKPKQNVVIELLVVIDYKIYWKELKKYRQNSLLATYSLKKYYSLVVRLVDQRFSAIDDDDYIFRVRKAGIYISTKRTHAMWVERPGLKKRDRWGHYYVDPWKSLGAFKDWLLTSQHKLEPYDHAMAFTAYEMVKADGSSNIGLAFTSSMCKIQWGFSLSLVQEQGGFASVGTAAHEIGHSLGAPHDGTQSAQACPAESNHLMTPATQISPEKQKNFYTFSRCSIDSFKQMLKKPETACLLDSEPPTWRQEKWPGQMMDADTQCRYVHGPRTGLCAVKSLQRQMCARLWCKIPDDPVRCMTSIQVMAVYGTSCGDRKMCVEGECVHHPDASPDTKCHFGDKDVGFCKKVVRRNPHVWCQLSRIQTRCCQTCFPYTSARH